MIDNLLNCELHIAVVRHNSGNNIATIISYHPRVGTVATLKIARVWAYGTVVDIIATVVHPPQVSIVTLAVVDGQL